MLVAWLTTLPAAALTGAVTWIIADILGAGLGGMTITLLMVGIAGLMFARAQSRPIGSHNVNQEWEPTRQPESAGV